MAAVMKLYANDDGHEFIIIITDEQESKKLEEDLIDDGYTETQAVIINEDMVPWPTDRLIEITH